MAQPGRAPGQEPPAGVEAPQDTPATPARESAEPLSLRYRFTEQYALAEDPAKPWLTVQYDVGALETIKIQTDKTQGAPDRVETSYKTIYTERPVQLTKLGDVTAATRRYEVFRMQGASQLPAIDPPLFHELTIWWNLRPGRATQVLSLTSGRPLRQLEYGLIAGQLFLPQLSPILPRTPARVGDTWQIPRPVGQALLGKLPEAGEYSLEATLVEIRKAATGNSLTAVIEISGQLQLDLGPGAVKARIHFVFEPVPADLPTPGTGASPKARTAQAGGGASRRNQAPVEARGRIAQVRMARVLTSPMGQDGRLRQTITRELTLERRMANAPGAGGRAPSAPLEIPDPSPTADEANSWLVYDDPKGRFHLRHPQELSPEQVDPTDPDRLDLVDLFSGEGKDVLVVMLAPKGQGVQRDIQFSDAGAMQRAIYSDWDQRGGRAQHGPAGWLPEADWAPLKRKVYHVEIGVRPEDAGIAGNQQAYVDYYLALIERNPGVRFEAITVRDDHVAFLKQVESIIKSFDFGSSSGRSPAPAPTRPAPSPAPPPGRSR